MPTRRLRPYDRLPTLDRELLAEWNHIVFKRTEISGGVFRLPEGSAARLAALYARCQGSTGWEVFASTAKVIANSSAFQAIIDGKFSLAVGVLERLRTHPRFSSLPKTDQERTTSLLAAAHLMAGDVSEAVELWRTISAAQAKPMLIYHDVAGAIEVLGKAKPDEQIDPHLLPVIGVLKSKAKKIQAIADGSTRATYGELAALFETQRIKMWERRQAKLRPAKKPIPTGH